EKSSGFTTPLDGACAAAARGGSSEFSASMPRPAAPRPRNVRRVIARTNRSFTMSIPRDELVQVEDRARDEGHRRQVDRALLRRQRRFARADERARGRGIGGKTLQVPVVQRAQDRALLRTRTPAQGTIENPLQTRVER